MAQSRPPGLQGWVTVGKDCGGDESLSIDGTGGGGANPPNDNSRGLWVFNTFSSTSITNARITFYYPSSLGTIPWTTASGNSGWSVPATGGPDAPISGFTGYTMYYSGGWDFYDLPGVEDDHHRATGRPSFDADVSIPDCGDDLPVYARRTVTVDGDVVSFLRGPVYL